MQFVHLVAIVYCVVVVDLDGIGDDVVGVSGVELCMKDGGHLRVRKAWQASTKFDNIVRDDPSFQPL